jgi:hypothetical protein
MVSIMKYYRWLILAALVAGGGFGCSDGDQVPAWCTATGALDTSCSGPHCVAVLVVDYKRLEPRGYRIHALDGSPVNRLDAEKIAHEHVTKTLGQPEPRAVDCERADDFIHCVLPYESLDQFLVVIHAHTGQILLAGPEIWADPEARGFDFKLSKDYKDAAAIGCTDATPQPDRKKFIITGQPHDGPASTPQQALETTLRATLTSEFVGQKLYGAFIISYAPAIGEFDRESADWWVFLHRE